MSRPKDLDFFLDESDFAPGPFLGDPAGRALLPRRRNWGRGIEWYASHFEPEAPVRGECSTAYTAPWYRGVAERMAALLPEARLIFIVRDPVERIVSHYWHARTKGGERRELAAALRSESNIYVARSRYFAQLEPFLERFPSSRIYIGRQEDLFHRRRETMRAIFRFLGVEESFWSPKMARLRNKAVSERWRRRVLRRLTSARIGTFLRHRAEAKWLVERLIPARSESETPKLSPGQRRELIAQLEDDIGRFERVTGWDLSEWRRPLVRNSLRPDVD